MSRARRVEACSPKAIADIRRSTSPQCWFVHSQSLGSCSSPISRFGHRLTTLHFQVVRSRVDDIRNLGAEGWLPQNAEIVTVQACLRDNAHTSQIQVEPAVLRNVSRGDFKFAPVRRCSGEVFHARIGVLGPGNQPLQGHMLRRTPALGEFQFPRTLDLDGSRHRRDLRL